MFDVFYKFCWEYNLDFGLQDSVTKNNSNMCMNDEWTSGKSLKLTSLSVEDLLSFLYFFSFSQNWITSHFHPLMQSIFKRSPKGSPFESWETSLLHPWMPAQHWRVSCCFHIVPLGLPAAVAHMGKQTRRWDKPITPQSEWTPAAAACSSSGLRALRGSIPMRASWISQRWELCASKACRETIFCLEIWHGGLLGQCCGRQCHTECLQEF